MYFECLAGIVLGVFDLYVVRIQSKTQLKNGKAY